MEVNYKKKNYYNTAKYPIRQPLIFTFLLYLVSKIALIGTKYKIEKKNMNGLKGPYILLSNHHYFIDFEISAIATFPRRVNNVATVDGYYRRPLLMELLGCICKRKFTTDLHLIKAIKRVLSRGDVLCMYPEARYTPIGTTAILPDSLGKLVKSCNVPVVVLLHHGNYLRTPFWNFRKARKVPLCTTMTQILTADDVAKMTADEINTVIRDAMQYDEYGWQKEQNIEISENFRAEGLHKVLYLCPHCKSEFKMSSAEDRLFCMACGKEWVMDSLGRLSATEGETYFSHIPDWFEWEREQVSHEVRLGEYFFEDEVDIYSLPHPIKFEHLGNGILTHTVDGGFTLKGRYNGQDYEINRTAQSMYGVHVEYDYCYLRPQDCIDISTEKDSFYCYPKKQNVVTKLSFATEEIYKYHMDKIKKEKVLKNG